MVKNFINFYQNQFGELILNNFKERVCMQNTMTGLFVMFVVLFSLQGFSQTPEKSEHPLLDKYYPQAQKPNTDTNKAITTQIKPATQTKPVPVPETKPAHALPTTPDVTTKTVPAVTTVSNVITTPDVTAIPVVTGTPVLNKQDTVTATVPVQKKIQPQPKPSKPYIDTRLGSSSPLYDTWGRIVIS